MQGVRATITPDFRSPEASAAGFVAHACHRRTRRPRGPVHGLGARRLALLAVHRGGPSGRRPPRLPHRGCDGRVVGVVTRRPRARVVGRPSFRRPRHRPREYVAPVMKAAAVKDFRVHLRVTSARRHGDEALRVRRERRQAAVAAAGAATAAAAAAGAADAPRRRARAPSKRVRSTLRGSSTATRGCLATWSDAFVRIAVRSDPNAEVLVAEDVVGAASRARRTRSRTR